MLRPLQRPPLLILTDSSSSPHGSWTFSSERKLYFRWGPILEAILQKYNKHLIGDLQVLFLPPFMGGTMVISCGFDCGGQLTAKNIKEGNLSSLLKSIILPLMRLIFFRVGRP